MFQSLEVFLALLKCFTFNSSHQPVGEEKVCAFHNVERHQIGLVLEALYTLLQAGLKDCHSQPGLLGYCIFIYTFDVFQGLPVEPLK